MAAILPLALGVASSAISGISQFQQSKYQAAVAKNNAQIANDNANRAGYASQIEQMRSDREYMAEQGTLHAAQAASGLDVLGKSQTLARHNLARVRGEQALDITQEGLYNVRNFQQQQANFLGEARAAKTQAWMGAAATAFDIGGQVASFGQKGGFKKKSLIGGTK
jgi:hypothetical protein